MIISNLPPARVGQWVRVNRWGEWTQWGKIIRIHTCDCGACRGWVWGTHNASSGAMYPGNLLEVSDEQPSDADNDVR
jgi:hypothetical protein